MDQEHGIHIDHKNNVWLGGGGGGDSQILKYTMDGKFVMQVGKKGARLRAGAARRSTIPTAWTWRASASRRRSWSIRRPTRPMCPTATSITASSCWMPIAGSSNACGARRQQAGRYSRAGPAEPAPRQRERRAARRQRRGSRSERASTAAVPQPRALRRHLEGRPGVCLRPTGRSPAGVHEGREVREGKTHRAKDHERRLRLGHGLSSDPQQTFLYVADGENSLIHILRRDTLEILTAFGEGGRQPGQWHGVHNIATDSQGNIYTTETYDGKRIQKFTYKGLGPVTKQYQGTPWPASAGRRDTTHMVCGPSFGGRRAGALCLRPAGCRHRAPTPTPPAIRYALAAWSNEQSGDVFAIAQDLDGYLWLGTPDGLVRFDGTRFQPWARAAAARCPRVRLPRSPVRLRVACGSLCRRRRRGSDRSRWHHVFPRRRCTVRRQRAPRGSSRHGVGGDRSRAVPIRRQPLVARDRGRRLRRRAGVQRLRGSRRPRVGRGARGLYRYDGTQLHLVDSTATYVDSLVEDDAGNLWVTDRAAIVKKLGTSSPCASIHASASRCQAGASFRTAAAACWSPRSAAACSVSRIRRRTPAARACRLRASLRGSPRALYRDRDDNIWVGMRGGLLRLSETRSNPRARSTVSTRMACGPRRSPLTAASGSPPRKP